MGTKRRATEVVQAARGRLKGALQDVINVAEEDDDDDAMESSTPNRGRPPKRPKKEEVSSMPAPSNPSQPPAQQSFIMKLFERSVDLAKYDESTSLYPICRAWMLNQPRSSAIASFKNLPEPESVQRELQPDLLEKINAGKVIEVNEMPKCENVDVSRVPSPLPFQRDASKDNIDLNYDIEEAPISREDLLADLKTKCTQVRTKWINHAKTYEDKRHGSSMAILEALYKK